MRIFVLPSNFQGTETFELEGKDAHYITKVLRLGEGKTFTGRDAQGEIYNLTIRSIKKGSCSLTCAKADSAPIATTDALPEYHGPFPEIHLYQAMCKGKKMEQIIRQATELGVTRIIPMSSEFCVVDIAKKEKERIQRYETIIKEAIQQSGSPILTQVAMPISVSEVISDWANRGTAMVFHQVAVNQQMSLTAVVKNHPGIKTPIAIIVGAEGGFSEREVHQLLESGVSPVLLKTNILRAETAAIAAIAITWHLLVDTQ